MDNKEFSKSKNGGDALDHADLAEEIKNFCLSSDKHFNENLLDWIDMIENADLHKALKSLSVEEQTLLSYLYFKDKTQTEVAKIYVIAQQNIGKTLYKIFNKIKSFLSNKYKFKFIFKIGCKKEAEKPLK